MAYERMTDEQLVSFLGAAPPRTAQVATTRADGRPHVAPVWYALDDDSTLVFMTGQDTIKGRSLLRDSRLAVCVDDEQPPFAFVMIEGIAEIIDDPLAVRRWAGIIGGRYMGKELAEEYGAQNGIPGELVVRVRAQHITAVQNVALPARDDDR